MALKDEGVPFDSDSGWLLHSMSLLGGRAINTLTIDALLCISPSIRGNTNMTPFHALFDLLDPRKAQSTPAPREAQPLKSSLRKPVIYTTPGSVQPIIAKKTVRLSLPAPAMDTGRYHDFDYRQTRGVS
jgi:hypothetical protein